jgi:hypothetical protein
VVINARKPNCRLRAGLSKLAYNGLLTDAISSFFGLNTQMVQQIIANDPMHRARVVQSIKERSEEYRCAQSNRLMISPVMARDGNLYEQNIFEADPSLSDQSIPSPKLKAKIEVFSKESLTVLEQYLQHKHPQEDILQLIAECLSVLSHEAGLESALRVLGAVEGLALRKLIGKLKLSHRGGAFRPYESASQRAPLSCPLPGSANHPGAA